MTYNEDINRKKSITRLLFFNNEHGINGYFMTIIADNEYLKSAGAKAENNNYLKQEQNFNGLIIYHNFNGEYVAGKNFAKMSSVIDKQQSLHPIAKEKASLANPDACQDITIWEVFGVGCQNISPDWMLCESVYSLPRTLTICGSGGNTNPTLPGGTPTPWGNPGGTTYVQRDTLIESNFYANAKAMCALNKLMQNNFYKNTLNNFLGVSKPIDLSFKLENITQEIGFLTKGNTVPNPRTWSSTNIDITVAANLIDSLPSITVATTLLHEGIHAEIYRKLLSIHGPNNLNAKNFPSLFNIWIKSREWEGVSHEFMANYYINTMANAIKQYDNNKFDFPYYAALAWSGLKQTEFYNDNSKVSVLKRKEIDSLTNIVLKGRSKVNCNDL